MMPLASVSFLPGIYVPTGREHPLHASARVRRTADDLDLAVAGFDDADLEPLGVGMLLGFND